MQPLRFAEASSGLQQKLEKARRAREAPFPQLPKPSGSVVTYIFTPQLCKRCTAWDETQEPDVVPAPLETGHVSVEELTGELWDRNYQTPEDFFPDVLRPRVGSRKLDEFSEYG